LPDSLPFITNPWFYASALPAALLIGLSKSGFAAGFSALAVPMMALTIAVPQAAAILLPVLMVADAAGLQKLWRERDRALVRLLVPAGLVGIVIGWLLFRAMAPKTVSAVVGSLTLLFLAQRLLFPPSKSGRAASAWVGRLSAVASGFTSFVSHTGGPPLAAYLYPLRLEPRRLNGTSAVYFAVINAAKVVPYATLGLIDLRNMATSALLIPLAPLGVWLGVWLTSRVSADAFYKFAYGGMFLTGVKLLWDGLT
jgi:uncharacterized membrane protein YfcA